MTFSTTQVVYQQCTKTVMDNIADPDIRFDSQGICNYYYDYQRVINCLPGDAEKEIRLRNIAEEIKLAGKGRPYNCLIGLSGGVDSTYVALLTKQLGLRPLAVHLDNGWDSELAIKNIENIVTKLGIDLFTLVVNWEEFRDIQLSYLKASVVDIEVVSDHAIFATMYKLAKEKDIQYILSGTNIVTEFIMPPSWLYPKMDFLNLQDIHSKYGSVKLDTYPRYDFKRHVFYSAVKRLKYISILDYTPYNKSIVKDIISTQLDWRDYGGKHYESLFTKFYQAYILPTKFHIDKRKAHLSTLICSGQMTRDEALKELTKSLYADEDLARDKEYVLKKLRLSEAEFDKIMRLPIRKHEEFASDLHLKRKYMSALEATKPVRDVLKRLIR
jgi:N-acetyl sugar amidotransferase